MNSRSKAKYQPWVEDAFSGNHRVRRMTNVQRWIYRTLLSQAFVCSTRPRLPDDDDELWMMADCENLEQWVANKAAVLTMFKRVVVDGVPMLSHHRLEEDWMEVQNIRESRSKAGKRSGESRNAETQDNGACCLSKPEIPDLSTSGEFDSPNAYAMNSIRDLSKPTKTG
jgi:hypothetical protein